MRALYVTSGRSYQDPHQLVDDYGNLVDFMTDHNLWDVESKAPIIQMVAAAMYFKYGRTAFWPQ